MADPLGVFRGSPGGTRLAGQLALVGSLALTVWLQQLELRLRREEAALWWASNGRDFINGFSLAAILLSLWLNGLPGPSALLGGSTLLLAIILFERVLLRQPGLEHPVLYALLFALALATPFLVDAASVHSALTWAALRLGG
jgi:hypothetical protein